MMSELLCVGACSKSEQLDQLKKAHTDLQGILDSTKEHTTAKIAHLTAVTKVRRLGQRQCQHTPTLPRTFAHYACLSVHRALQTATGKAVLCITRCPQECVCQV